MTTSTAPFLQRFEPALQKELLAAAQKKTVEEGSRSYSSWTVS